MLPDWSPLVSWTELPPLLLRRRNPSPVPNCLRCSTGPLSRSSHHPELMSLPIKTGSYWFRPKMWSYQAKRRQRSSLQAAQTAEWLLFKMRPSPDALPCVLITPWLLTITPSFQRLDFSDGAASWKCCRLKSRPSCLLFPGNQNTNPYIRHWMSQRRET